MSAEFELKLTVPAAKFKPEARAPGGAQPKADRSSLDSSAADAAEE
jgi:hypothetical protein